MEAQEVKIIFHRALKEGEFDLLRNSLWHFCKIDIRKWQVWDGKEWAELSFSGRFE